MGKLWIPGGGSGAGSGSDECTASKSEVLKGYSAVTSDSDDEPAQGTLELTGDASDGQVLSGKTYYNTDAKKKRNGSMANQGAVSVKLNAGEGYTIPSGFHNGGGKVEANGLASQTGGTATAAHILSGQSAWVNGNKVDGAIPLQNADVAGSDRAWSQGMSNWAGTINLKVRNGCYLNGVNWIQQSIPEYQPGNIKKGVDIGGVVGTWEGYVPTATDLYLRGNNIAGFVKSNTVAINTLFESGQITIGTTSIPTADGNYVYAQKNLTGYSYINVECYCNTGYNAGPSLGISVGSTITNYAVDNAEAVVTSTSGVGYKTVTLNISAINATKYIKVFVVDRTSAYVYRIWLS